MTRSLLELATVADPQTSAPVAPTFTFTADHQGEHVHVIVRAGVAGSRAKCGELVMRRAEWEAFRERIAPGSEADQVVMPIAVTAEDRLAALVGAMQAVEQQATWRHSHVAIYYPTDEVAAFAVANGGEWKGYQPDSKTGHIDVNVAGGQVTVYDVPRPPPREAAPLPACPSCESTACPSACPCGAGATGSTTTSVDDVDDIPF